MQHSITAVDATIRDQQGLLRALGESWSGDAGQAALDLGRSTLAAHSAFRDRLHTTQQVLSRGGGVLSELREHILSAAVQVAKVGGVLSDDGYVTSTGIGPLLSPEVAMAYSVVLRRLLATFTAADTATAAALCGERTGIQMRAADFPGGIWHTPTVLDLTRRSNETAAFMEVFGRKPKSSADWQTAAALDPHSYAGRYEGRPPSIVVGRIEPVPGQGFIKAGLFIPRDQVFNVPRNDLGDNRGFDTGFQPEDTRVSLYVDYENGLVIARQNPSVDVEGDVAVLTPVVKVQQTPEGAVRIQYEAKNAFAPPGAEVSRHVVAGDVVVTPGIGGQPATVDGVIGNYPSLEIYQSMPDGSLHTLAQDAADSGNILGPLTELPFRHEIGNGSAAFEPFASHAPPLPGWPWYRGDIAPYIYGQIDPNTPTDLGPTDEVPNVVVVR
ncbi:hypothetical protein ASJ79_27135 [Mycobacterium sp. NAZ190054]|nr:hypothetical protein ASJ79_27135 [Mycobacterium sp. NAZ190054]